MPFAIAHHPLDVSKQTQTLGNAVRARIVERPAASGRTPHRSKRTHIAVTAPASAGGRDPLHGPHSPHVGYPRGPRRAEAPHTQLRARPRLAGFQRCGHGSGTTESSRGCQHSTQTKAPPSMPASSIAVRLRRLRLRTFLHLKFFHRDRCAPDAEQVAAAGIGRGPPPARVEAAEPGRIVECLLELQPTAPTEATGTSR